MLLRYFLFVLCLVGKVGAKSQEQPVVFAFDLHDVLMRYDKRELVCNLFKKPSLVYKILWNIRGFFNDQNIDNDELRPIYNFHKPIEASWKILYRLKEAGYPIYLFSNINERAYQDLRLKFPGRFDLFEGTFPVPTFSNCKKPGQCAFEKFRKLVDQKHRGALIIFIDDIKENVAGAVASDLNYHAIVFKNAAQLEKDLEPWLSHVVRNV